MERIIVIGPCGAGKSTLAGRLSKTLDLPLIHMDQLYWKAGWIEGDKLELKQQVMATASQERWVIDGNYGSTLTERLNRAEMVVYLDFPTRICAWRIIRRWLKYRGRTRPDMTADCPERLDLEFIWYLLRWRSGPGLRTDEQLLSYSGPLMRLRNPREVRQWLAAFT